MDALGFPDRSQCICGREASSSQPSTTAVHTLQELQSAILCGTTGCLQQRRPSQLPHFGSEHNVTWRKAMRSAIKVLHHFAQLCQAQFSCKCSGSGHAATLDQACVEIWSFSLPDNWEKFSQSGREDLSGGSASLSKPVRRKTGSCGRSGWTDAAGSRMPRCKKPRDLVVLQIQRSS